MTRRDRDTLSDGIVTETEFKDGYKKGLVQEASAERLQQPAGKASSGEAIQPSGDLAQHSAANKGRSRPISFGCGARLTVPGSFFRSSKKSRPRASESRGLDVRITRCESLKLFDSTPRFEHQSFAAD
jgi:hypothetical protein